MLTLVGEPAHARSAIVKNRSAGTAAVAAITTRNHNSRGMFFREELARLLAKLEALDEVREEVSMIAHMYRIIGHLLQIGIFITFEERLVDRLHISHRPKEDDLSRQLSFVLLQIFLVVRIDPNSVSTHRAMARRRPRQRLRDEYRRIRRRHTYPRIQLPPTN